MENPLYRESPKQRRWNGVDDPVNHCLAGNSLLLTGLPGNDCGGAQTADYWVRRHVRASLQKLDWLVVEEITQLDMALLCGAERST